MQESYVVVGIDLAGKPKNPTGFCMLRFVGDSEETKVLLCYEDEEIISRTGAYSPRVICIDAPLSFPKEEEWYRACDLELIRRGIRVLSPKLPAMRLLTQRGMRLAKIFREKGYEVIEVFPRATERILGLSKGPRINQDKYDALLCAITGKYYLMGKFEVIGDEEGKIVIPKP